MNPETKKQLKEYAELKIQEKKIGERLDELKPQIVEAMAAQDLDKVEAEVGTFTIEETSRWQYSPAVSDLQEAEKANGLAKRVVSTILKFRQAK